MMRRAISKDDDDDGVTSDSIAVDAKREDQDERKGVEKTAGDSDRMDGSSGNEVDYRCKEESDENKDDTAPSSGDSSSKNSDEDAAAAIAGNIEEEDEKEVDPKVREHLALIASREPRTELELALAAELERKEASNRRLTNEVAKLKAFVSKRKQTYKRKRKESGAPTRPLSAYNIFIKDRFKKLSRENEEALKSEDAGKQLKRVPPASLVASTGHQWRELSAQEKSWYEERAKADRKRYQEEMANYQAPEKMGSRKRAKTGYNMFFSVHVLKLKQTEGGVPSERGSVARLVGEAWKKLSPNEKQFYESQADKNNQENPIESKGEEDNEAAHASDAKGNNNKDGQHLPPQAGGAPPPPLHQGMYPPYDYGAPPPPGVARQQGGSSAPGLGGPAESAHGQYSQDMAQQAVAYSQYGMYGGQGHPPPQAYGGYPHHHGGQGEPYGYPPPPYGYPQHPGYSQYPQDNNSSHGG